MTEPFDANAFPVTDNYPEHIVPNHKAKGEAPQDKPSFMTKLRGEPARGKRETPSLPRERKPVPAYREGMYVQPMEDFYNFLALTFMPFRPAAAAYLTMPEITFDANGESVEGLTGAQKCAQAWDAAAKKSEAVRRMLESFLQVSVWGTLIAVHLPLIMALTSKTDGENMFSGLESMLKQHAGSDE